MVFAIERPISLTFKTAQKRENPKKIGNVESHFLAQAGALQNLNTHCFVL